MIEKRLKKLWKLSALIGIRQGYFLGRNWYLLYGQPYLTIKELVETRDKSQIVLVAATAFIPTILYLIGRIIWDLWFYHQLILVTGKVFILTAIVQLVILMYLGYWTLKVWREK